MSPAFILSRLDSGHQPLATAQRYCSFSLTFCNKSPVTHFEFSISSCLLPLLLPDWSFIMRMALALASSRAVTHLCRSTSVLAFRWYVRPPLLRTILQASSVSMCAVARLIVPRHVWAISACVLQNNTNQKERQKRTRERGRQADTRWAHWSWIWLHHHCLFHKQLTHKYTIANYECH